MKIDDGTNISSSLTKVIGVSFDDINWGQYLKKTSVDTITGVIDQMSVPTVIVCSSSGTLIEFILADVTNQPTWTNDQSGLNQAVLDISSWL